MNFIDSFFSNIKKVLALIALMLLLTLVILIFTHTSLGYFLVLLPLTLLIIYLLHKIKKLGRLQVQVEQNLSSNYISGIHLIKKSVEQFIRSVVA